MTRRSCTSLTHSAHPDAVAMFNAVKAERRRRNKAARASRKANR